MPRSQPGDDHQQGKIGQDDIQDEGCAQGYSLKIMHKCSEKSC
jgi:hypothetical protein